MATSDDIRALSRRVRTQEAERGDFSRLSRHLMKMGEFRRAQRVLVSAVGKFERLYQDFFTDLGTCEWVLDNSDAAVDTWRAGLNCGYRDPAGGIYPTILLWFASVATRSEESEREAVECINQRLQSARAIHWPGHIARFVIDEISEEELIRIACEKDQHLIQPGLKREALFYIAVRSFRDGQQDRAQLLLADCVQMFLEAKEYDLYLAKHELSKIAGGAASGEANGKRRTRKPKRQRKK